MTPEDFKQYMKDRTGSTDYGICPPPLSAQEALDILTTHFLGNDWCVTTPCCTEQVNTEAVHDILWSYPKKQKLFVNLFYGGNKDAN